VTDVKVSLLEDEVEVIVDYGGGKLNCPTCGKTCPGYDKLPSLGLVNLGPKQVQPALCPVMILV